MIEINEKNLWHIRQWYEANRETPWQRFLKVWKYSPDQFITDLLSEVNYLEFVEKPTKKQPTPKVKAAKKPVVKKKAKKSYLL